MAWNISICYLKGCYGIGICADVGIGPKSVDEVVVVFKSFVTRVGEGPLKNEISPEKAAAKGWQEVGTVTGRQRRAAEFDFDLAKTINNVKQCYLNWELQNLM